MPRRLHYFALAGALTSAILLLLIACESALEPPPPPKNQLPVVGQSYKWTGNLFNVAFIAQTPERGSYISDDSFFSDGNRYRLALPSDLEPAEMRGPTRFDLQFEVQGTLTAARTITVSRIKTTGLPAVSKATSELMTAIRSGQINLLTSAIAAGADPNVGPLNTGSLISLFGGDVSMGHHDRAAFAAALTKAGANVNAMGPDGKTALHLASRYADRDTALILVEAGADVNVLADTLPRSALAQALSMSGPTDILPTTPVRGEIVSILLRKGAELAPIERTLCYGPRLDAFRSGISRPESAPRVRCE